MKKIIIYSLLAGGMIFLLGCSTATKKPEGYQLAYSETFKNEEVLKSFTFTDPAVWTFSPEGKGSGSLACTARASYVPKVRSPFAIALISEKQFGSFVLEANLQQTGREYGHQDMCIFFGFQNPSQFYYVHISRAMDDHANNFFIVNNEPRTKISLKTNEGQDWKNGSWHNVRLERDLKSGSMRLFFDDMTQPVMEANDLTFGSGGIGFGTFDDEGKIDNVKIWADTWGDAEAVEFISQ